MLMSIPLHKPNTITFKTLSNNFNNLHHRNHDIFIRQSKRYENPPCDYISPSLFSE